MLFLYLTNNKTFKFNLFEYNKWKAKDFHEKFAYTNWVLTLSFPWEKGSFDRSAKHRCVFGTLLNVYDETFSENSQLLKTVNYFSKKTPYRGLTSPHRCRVTSLSQKKQNSQSFQDTFFILFFLIFKAFVTFVTFLLFQSNLYIVLARRNWKGLYILYID